MSTTNYTIIFLCFGQITGHPEDFTGGDVSQAICRKFVLYGKNTAASKEYLSGIILIDGLYSSKF